MKTARGGITHRAMFARLLLSDFVIADLTVDDGERVGVNYLDQALEQGRDPDRARRARGEADFLTSRALKLAPDNDEVKKLRDEVVKLLELKPN